MLLVTESVHEVFGKENDGLLGRVGADFFESLESADVDTAGSLGEHTGGFGDGGSGGFFAFGRDDSGAAFAFGFGLLGHGAFHVGGELDILKFDIFNINTPFVGLGVDDFADLSRDFVTFAENFVEVEIAGHIAQSGLSEGASSVRVIGGFEDGFGSVDDTEVDDSVDIDGDVVASDDFLLWNVHRGGANVDFAHFVDIGNDNAKAGLEYAREFTEAENYAALVLIDNADARDDDQENNCY